MTQKYAQYLSSTPRKIRVQSKKSDDTLKRSGPMKATCKQHKHLCYFTCDLCRHNVTEPHLYRAAKSSIDNKIIDPFKLKALPENNLNKLNY